MKQCGAEKKKGGSKVNGLFRAIATATIVLAKNKKKAIFFQDCLLSSSIGMDIPTSAPNPEGFGKK